MFTVTGSNNSPRPVAFVPVTITLNSIAEVAAVIGALLGYGTNNAYAEGNLKKLGLGAYYNGNVRKSARELAEAILTAAKVEASAEGIISEYTNSPKFSSSSPSKAGSAVTGTNDDLAPGRVETHFEDGTETTDSEDEEEFDEEVA
jgi:hypothetical protein